MNLKINKKQIPFIGDRNIDKACYMTFLGMSLAFSCGFCFATAPGIWTQACPGSTAGVIRGRGHGCHTDTSL